MNTMYEILGILGALLIVWILYRFVRAKPETLKAESLSKSFFTMGILALILIAFVGVLILMARSM